MSKLEQVVARVEHEVALTSIFVDMALATVKQDAARVRVALRDRVKHTTLYHVYGWSRAMAAI